jgi:hypothetical protein
MKKMKNNFKLLALTFLLGILTSSLMGQDYKSGIGLRFGTWGAAGVTFKHFINENTALEANLNFRSYSSYYGYNGGYTYIEVTGLYEKYGSISDIDGLKYYFGGGPVVGIFSYSDGYSGSDAAFRLGIAGVIGLEYKFSNVPIAISTDYMPSYNLLGGRYFSSNRGGLAVRYTF